MAVAEEIVALAVVGGDAVLADGLAVLLRGIALVGEPVVLGIFLCQAVHVVITIGLGEDAGGSDSEVFAVALDNRRMGQLLAVSRVLIGLEAVAIDDDGLRAHFQLIQCPMHGEDRGVEDIDLVDLLGGDDAHSPGYGIALDDLTQLIAALLRELLRVVEELVLITVGQDDGSSIDTACQAATTSLVAACLNLAFVPASTLPS